MRKLFLVLGCLFFSSYAFAENFNCDKIKQIAFASYQQNDFFWEQGESKVKDNDYEGAKENFRYADEAMKKAAHWATLYIAFCKD